MATTHLLRPCALQRATAPFQRTTQSSTALIGSSPAHAAGPGLNRYIRRKTLDPLETYVPLVLEARGVLSQAKSLAAKDVGAARELLRQGPFSGLRDNIRAIGEYAARDGRTTEVGPLVTGFFKALESYDQLLYNALRDKATPKPDEVEARIQDLYTAFDRLLATVPSDILDQANRVLEVAAAKAATGAVDASFSSAGPVPNGGAGAPVVDDEAAELVMLLR
ncbi:hypothetical protein VOLCADRAFT_117192 [Volvox carteri f. nagariensis]|uniref:DUF7880 domain-containing protein n=1 Tax=Volvox carteri f. nagariensis TaxID=3068 RepID=D8TSN4_VOLCA|nr:uncharacterized protein VOLCADRAFT_117192 [Volvox carteri f. nagariensis]EFJ49401.1 hypothetical protein VOLCADRAFT_117192 [Volvox carteri f. nagariensis]|eukprot:XP_002949382.1 hypothetical protein VOLCADRAFT_117192 [Volvox carteri f. nagariensis]